MSKDSSEINVQDCDVSETSKNEEEQKIVVDIISRWQVIYDAIVKLNKKCDVINGKVTKIQQRGKSFWHYRRPLGLKGKYYSSLLSQKTKAQKMKRETYNSFCSENYSYSPTSPVRRPGNDNENDYMITSINSNEEPQEIEPESPFRGPDISFRENTGIPYAGGPFHNPYFAPDGSMSVTSMAACSGTSQPPSPGNISAGPEAVLVYREPSPVFNPVPRSFPALMENNNLPSLCLPSGFATSSPINPDRSVLKQQDTILPQQCPSTWSVEDVLLFLNHIDPKLSDELADLFRQHDIDGKALLLLNNRMMMKYLGMKLGSALKLCHYIEKLKKISN